MSQTAYNVNSYNRTNTAYKAQNSEGVRRRQPQTRRKPDLQVKRGGKIRISPVFWMIGHALQLLAVAMVVGLSVNLLRSNATLNEMDRAIQEKQNTLVSLQSENNYYRSVINSKTNISNVEEAAGRLGLMKINESQITYVRLSDSSVIVRKEPTVRDWTDLVHAGALTLTGKAR